MSKANIIEELTSLGFPLTYASETQVKILCPFHEDINPSLAFYLDSHTFKCFGCKKTGDFTSFLALYSKRPRSAIVEYLEQKYGKSEGDLTIEPSLIEKYHQRIWNSGPLLKALRDRAVSDDVIRRYRLGEDRGRITIPIPNQDGVWVNIRRYLPGATEGAKFTNMRGKRRGRPRVYPHDQLKYDKLLLCGGEVKALAAIPHLNPHGIGAVSVTCGEGNWNASLTHHFNGKLIWVGYDIDDEGRKASAYTCALLCAVATGVHDLVVPLPIDKYPKGGVDDFIAWGGDILAELDAAPAFVPPEAGSAASSEEPESLRLAQLNNPIYANRRILVEALVSAVDHQSFLIPKTVEPICNRDQPACGVCPVFSRQAEYKYMVSPESLAVIEMMHTDIDKHRDVIRKSLGIPPCKTVTFKALSYYTVEDTLISPDLDDEDTSVRKESLHAVCVDANSDLNETYAFEGTLRPHPRTQRATVIVSKSNTTLDALSKFELRDPDQLSVYQPEAWTAEALAAKLDDIYLDYEANVTRIWKRRDLHLLIDLAYHSVLLIPFHDGHERGWVEVLALGDTSQGKSEASRRMRDHYGLGQRLDCKNATVAGLLGGLDNIDGRWFVKWGVIPTNDRRLVILEELKGMNEEVLAKLTDMRSSGIAELPKIERRRTQARTRLVVLSNPRGDVHVGSFGYGVTAIKELVGNLEDVRRFDAFLVLSKDEVAPEVMHQRSLTHAHTYTRDISRKLVLWSWTRSHEHIDFQNFDYLQQVSGGLCNKFVDDIPIVDRGSMRLKLARLATALACRTFSTDDGVNVVVRDCHVDYIADWLTAVYTRPAFGYDRYSDAARKLSNIKDPDKLEVEIRALPHSNDFVENMLATTRIDTRHIQDWCSWTRDQASEFMSLLVRKNALIRDGTAFYRKTPAFIELLRRVDVTRPAHIPNERF